MWLPSWHQLQFPLAFVCASVIHGGLLWLPLPPPAAELEPLPPPSKDSASEAIATVPLADLVTPAPRAEPPPRKSPQALASLPPAPQSVPEVAPEVVAPPPFRPQTTAPSKASPKAVRAPQNQPNPKQEDNGIEPASVPEPSPDQGQEVESEVKTIEPSPVLKPKRELIAGIAHLEGAQSGCYGSDDCHFLAGATVRAVTQDLQARLEAEGFSLSESYRDTGLRVYKVYRQDKPPQFLHIVSDNAGRDAFYLLSPEQKTLEELRSP
ncbi:MULTISPECIES: hypothetical protein [unclassified Synechocystis]|uniref:hypothetical protein n=1 Tax=unclassified Synechocystis TaxID=2640012 RepID=UPI000404B00F|nr:MULTISPECIES: hypothetical protein [unclassified Synechocystis]AIE72857.1 hypothetical protein D082_03280 [Synechocystis sp. PCC 6714]